MKPQLWIRKLLVLVAMMSVLVTACDRTRTVEKAEKLAIELRLYNRNIAKVTNDAFREGKISSSLHLGVITGCDKFSKALDGTDRAIAAVKIVTEASEVRTGLDFVQRLFDTEVFSAFIAIGEAVIDVPPDLKARLDSIFASIRLAFAAVRALFADAQHAMRGENYG